MPRKTTTKQKPQKRKTRVVYVREEDDGLNRTVRTVGNLAVLGIGLGIVGSMMGGMRR